MTILFLTISCALFCIAAFIYKVKFAVSPCVHSTVIKTSAKCRYEDGALIYEGVSIKTPLLPCALDFGIVNQKPLRRYSVRRGAKLQRIADYGSFRLCVTQRQRGKFILYEIEHTHIVPQTVFCKSLAPSAVKQSDNGFYFDTYSGKSAFGITIENSHALMPKSGELEFSMLETVLVKCIEGEIPLYLSAKKRDDIMTQNPIYVDTPTPRLNEYFNEWIWSIISENGVCDTRDFEVGIAVCSVKMCYIPSETRDFLRLALIDQRNDLSRAMTIILLFCEYMRTEGNAVLYADIGGFKPVDLILRSLSKAADRLNARADGRLLKLYLAAASEFMNYLEAPDVKLELFDSFEFLKARAKISSERIKEFCGGYLWIYYEFTDEMEIRTAAEIYKAVRYKKNPYAALKAANPLVCAEKGTSDFSFGIIGACLFWRAFVREILGIKPFSDSLTFSPYFPDEWDSVKVKYRSSQGNYDIELISGNTNMIKINGVNYSGGCIPRATDSCYFVKVYFTK